MPIAQCNAQQVRMIDSIISCRVIHTDFKNKGLNGTLVLVLIVSKLKDLRIMARNIKKKKLPPPSPLRKP